MRILFILSNAFCPEYFSGPNRTLLELCQKLTDSGHEPVVLAGNSKTITNTDILVDRTFGFRLFRVTSPLKSIAPLCATLRPDIAVIVDGYQERIIEECRTVDIPLAVWFFQVKGHYYRDSLPDNSLLYLVSSPFLATRIYTLYGIKAEVVFPYIERTHYHKTRHGERVLFVNPVREKGVELVYRLAGKRPGIIFDIVESRKISAEWRAICFERVHQGGNIEWYTAGHDMNFIFDQTRLLLVPRINEEGFCRLVTEAQLGGIPVLSSDRGYLPDNVGHGGIILPVDDDYQLWLRELDRFMEDEPYYQQMSIHARNHALRDELNGDQIVDHLLMLLTARISKFSQRRFA